MKSEFIESILDWNKKRDVFVASRLSIVNERLAPRKAIFITIPLEFEEEIKTFVKEKRQESDRNLAKALTREKVTLSLEFESQNPPPHTKDF